MSTTQNEEQADESHCELNQKPANATATTVETATDESEDEADESKNTERTARNECDSKSKRDEVITDGRCGTLDAEDQINAVADCYRELDRLAPPACSDVAEYSGYTVNSFARLGNWDDILRSAGVPTLTDLCEEWIIAYIGQSYGTTRHFRSVRIADDLGTTPNHICRRGLKPLADEIRAANESESVSGAKPENDTDRDEREIYQKYPGINAKAHGRSITARDRVIDLAIYDAETNRAILWKATITNAALASPEPVSPAGRIAEVIK